MSSKSENNKDSNRRLRHVLKNTFDFTSKCSGRFLNRANYGSTLATQIRGCREKPSPYADVDSVKDPVVFNALYSSRFILEDLNNEEGRKKLAEITGLPLGVIVDAMNNIFK